jgi:hypothetical protein
MTITHFLERIMAGLAVSVWASAVATALVLISICVLSSLSSEELAKRARRVAAWFMAKVARLMKSVTAGGGVTRQCAKLRGSRMVKSLGEP